jgi:hypothetical protein
VDARASPLNSAPSIKPYLFRICKNLQTHIQLIRGSSQMRLCLLLVLGCSGLLAQEGQQAEQGLGANSLVASPPSDIHTPLTATQQYLWSLHQVFDPTRLFFLAAHAAIDHSRDDPAGWGQGSTGYTTRVANYLARAAVRENMAFAIRELDREDPRYVRSASAGVWKRTRYAISRTLVARNDRGGSMPAYSTLVSNFATPFIAQTWRPEPVSAGHELRSGGLGLGLIAAGNIGQEFWPDLRGKLHR